MVNARNNFLMVLPKWKDSLIKSVKIMKKKIQMEGVEALALAYVMEHVQKVVLDVMAVVDAAVIVLVDADLDAAEDVMDAVELAVLVVLIIVQVDAKVAVS